MTATEAAIFRVRCVGFAEAISSLILFCVAMPLKYAYGLKLAVTLAGGVHGGLFLLLLLALTIAARRTRWPLPRLGLLVFAAVLPGGPFFCEGWLREEQVTARRREGNPGE
jgi:integral membrane protein